MPVLLITGAGRGIGAATASLAGARGYDVGVNYKSDAKSAGDVTAAVKAQAARPGDQADMGREADVERMFKEPMRSGADPFRLQRRHSRPRGAARDADFAMMRR
jgi:NAD(P)-dependent dehydrogenase (short-subunit alcohol dehydrogenase family)